MTKDDKTMAMLCHLLSLTGYIGVPAGHIIGPLIIWLLKKDQSDYVDAHGKESLNFQLSMTLWFIVCIPLAFVIIGFVGMLVLAIGAFILAIIAAMKANEGEMYYYPLTIRFIK